MDIVAATAALNDALNVGDLEAAHEYAEAIEGWQKMPGFMPIEAVTALNDYRDAVAAADYYYGG